MFQTIYEDNFVEFYATYKEHIDKHYKDFAATFNGDRALDVDTKLMQHMVDLGNQNFFTLWDDDTFIGYISVSISPSVLFKGSVDAVVDHFYIVEEYRGKGYAKEILNEIEQQLKADRVGRYSIALPATEAHDKFAEANGFTKQSCIHFRTLGDN